MAILRVADTLIIPNKFELKMIFPTSKRQTLSIIQDTSRTQKHFPESKNIWFWEMFWILESSFTLGPKATPQVSY